LFDSRDQRLYKLVVKYKGKDFVKLAFKKLLQNVSLELQFLDVPTKQESETSTMSDNTKIALHDVFAKKRFHVMVRDETKQLALNLCGQKAKMSQ